MADDNVPEELPKSLDLDHVSPATRLLEKRRRMLEVEGQLQARRDEFMREQEHFKQKEDSIAEKDVDFQKSLVKFNRFLKENEIKKNRAEKKAQEERQQLVILKEELEAFVKENEELEAEKETLKQEVAKDIKFQKYLENVQESAPDDYPELNDLLNRYKVLQSTQDYIKSKNEKYLKRNEDLAHDFETLVTESENKILSLTNSGAQKQSELETQLKNQAEISKNAKREAQKAEEKGLELGIATLAIENILLRCSAKFGKILKHGNQTTKTQDEEGNNTNLGNVAETEAQCSERAERACLQLDVICSYILDFKKTISNLQQQKTLAL